MKKMIMTIGAVVLPAAVLLACYARVQNTTTWGDSCQGSDPCSYHTLDPGQELCIVDTSHYTGDNCVVVGKVQVVDTTWVGGTCGGGYCQMAYPGGSVTNKVNDLSTVSCSAQ